MILRLVFSFFFVCLVAGNKWGHYGYPAHGLSTTSYSTNPQKRIETTSYDVKFASDNDIPSYQVSRPIQTIDENTSYTEKTICITLSMVPKLIKAALDYVIHMPSDLNKTVDKIDQELNRKSAQESLEELPVMKPLYPLDSRTIFQMLHKPTDTRTNLILKNELPGGHGPQCKEALELLISIVYNAFKQIEKHPQCRDYLYKFASHQPEDRPRGHIEGPEDRTRGHIKEPRDRPRAHIEGPDLKFLIATILDQIDKQKPNLNIALDENRYGEIDRPIQENTQRPFLKRPIPHSPILQKYFNIPQFHDYINVHPHEHNIPANFEIPQFHEYNDPKIHEHNIPPNFEIPQVYKYDVPKIHEHNIPPNFEISQFNEYDVPKIHEHNIPPNFEIPQVHKYDVPKIHEHNIPANFEIPQFHEYNVPKIHEHNIPSNFEIPQVHKYDVPKNHEHNIPPNLEIPQSHEYNVPKIHEHNIPSNFKSPQVHKYNVPKINEYRIPKIQEFNHIPHITDITIPPFQEYNNSESYETTQETIEENLPMQPKETINDIIKMLKNNDNLDNSNLFDRLITILEENQSTFHPRVFKQLITLLGSHKNRNNIPRLIDIFTLLLDSQKKQQWPWNDRITEHILSYLIPDQSGNLDSRIVDIILNLYKNRPNEKHTEYILSLLRSLKEGNLDTNVADTLLNLINAHEKNFLHPEYLDILLRLLELSQNRIGSPKQVDIINRLSKWNELGISPNQLDALFILLKPYVNGNLDQRLIDIIHFLLTQSKHLQPKLKDFILSFLSPENGILDTRRIDILHFLLNTLVLYPKHVIILLSLLAKNAPSVSSSRFMEILLFLNNNKLLNIELMDTIVNLLRSDITGQLDNNHVKTLFFLLAPYKQSNPKLLDDVLTLLNRGGLPGRIDEWPESANNNAGLSNHKPTIDNLHDLLEKPDIYKGKLPKQDLKNEYRASDREYQIKDGEYETPNGRYQPADNDFISIFRWLDSQGLLSQDQGSNTNLVNKILKVLSMGDRELGVVELTYKLKHEKPRIYQPVYYVKYRLPILSFITDMKNLLSKKPFLNTDPMKLLQELLMISNVTEISPNLQGYPKDEILKLTFNDGDLIQAKILDEQNLSLNDQIRYVHGLNMDISPEELLQLNRMNEATYFPNVVQVGGTEVTQPETIRAVPQKR